MLLPARDAVTPQLRPGGSADDASAHDDGDEHVFSRSCAAGHRPLGRGHGAAPARRAPPNVWVPCTSRYRTGRS
ncbi:hypothetical protein GCM10027028_18550 [Streptomyces sundarbansensis]